MKARTVLCEAISEDIGSVRLTEVDVPDPGPDEVRVRLKACSVNFPDLLMIQGKYQFKPPLPFAPGGEAAGDVEAVGDNVTHVKEGDPVVVGMRYGGFTEAITLPGGAVRPIPGTMSYAKAASYATAYLTAYVALVCRGYLEPDETLLVHGATGGVGMAAVDLGKRLGATVIATGGRDDKLAVVTSRGADHVLNYTQPDGTLGGFREEVKALTGGRGADVIYDPVGGDVFDESMRCINWGGRLLTIGFTSGRWPQAAVNLILIKQIAVIGVRAGEYGRRAPEKGRANNEALYAMAAAGEIDPYVCRGFVLDEAVDAMRLLENREVIGKTVVTMNGYTL
ncbi:MAG: NADPH:quinone oxidoreductase family protein [Gammaproteobacteria bacterium]|nr:NADPH:quinone oxidoreductase family protein [Gammaproteobacteria bacterium]